MIICICRKAFDKIQPVFMIKVLGNVGMEEEKLYGKSTDNIILTGKKTLKSDVRQRRPVSSLLFNILFKVFAASIR